MPFAFALRNKLRQSLIGKAYTLEWMTHSASILMIFWEDSNFLPGILL